MNFFIISAKIKQNSSNSVFFLGHPVYIYIYIYIYIYKV